jgi:hypothetical protein
MHILYYFLKMDDYNEFITEIENSKKFFMEYSENNVKEIPLLGRIMAIADVYYALRSARPYKRAFTHEEAVQIIIEQNGTHFDPTLIEILKCTAGQFKE